MIILLIVYVENNSAAVTKCNSQTKPATSLSCRWSRKLNTIIRLYTMSVHWDGIQRRRQATTRITQHTRLWAYVIWILGNQVFEYYGKPKLSPQCHIISAREKLQFWAARNSSVLDIALILTPQVCAYLLYLMQKIVLYAYAISKQRRQLWFNRYIAKSLTAEHRFGSLSSGYCYYLDAWLSPYLGK